MINNRWQLQDAKNKFSKLVDIAQQTGPQVVTKHGQEAVVVISIDEYKRLVKPQKKLISFFQDSPLADSNLELDRIKDLPRSIDL